MRQVLQRLQMAGQVLSLPSTLIVRWGVVQRASHISGVEPA
jgi:hypothetical protein